MSDEARLRTCHALVDTLIGFGLSPGSAFRFVGEVLALDETDEDWPPTFEVRHWPVANDKGGPRTVVTRLRSPRTAS